MSDIGETPRLSQSDTQESAVDAFRELDHRSDEGIDVFLLLNTKTNQVEILYVNENTGEQFTIDIPSGASPLEVFQNPLDYPARCESSTSDNSQPGAETQNLPDHPSPRDTQESLVKRFQEYSGELKKLKSVNLLGKTEEEKAKVQEQREVLAQNIEFILERAVRLGFVVT